MAGDLLEALAHQRFDDNSTFTFQHKLCHDFESLIWVIVYAMMIHHRNYLAATDQVMYGKYKEILDSCWAVHSYSNLHRCHNHMIMIGCSSRCRRTVSSWFPDALEAAFFRDAMRLILNQTLNEEPISYEGLCTLFKKHIQLGTESIPAEPTSAA